MYALVTNTELHLSVRRIVPIFRNCICISNVYGRFEPIAFGLIPEFVGVLILSLLRQILEYQSTRIRLKQFCRSPFKTRCLSCLLLELCAGIVVGFVAGVAENSRTDDAFEPSTE